MPDDYKLGDAQQLQVRAHKKQQPIIDQSAIEQVLRSYTFPLYFFDYETYAPAIPAFDGFALSKNPVSILVAHPPRQGGEPEHVEFLHLDRSDPTAAVAELLERHIEPKGTVVVWYAPFERGVNKEIGEAPGRLRRPDGADQRPGAGPARHIFQTALRASRVPGQHVDQSRDAGAGAGACPTTVLAIKEGTMASEQWWKMTADDTPAGERERIAQALRAYCGLDSYAMFAIWRKLQEGILKGGGYFILKG